VCKAGNGSINRAMAKKVADCSNKKNAEDAKWGPVEPIPHGLGPFVHGIKGSEIFIKISP
jgi:hypothetical protein